MFRLPCLRRLVPPLTALTSLALLAMPSLTRAEAAPPVVQTRHGQLSGSVANGVRAFLGVPYAAPPLGALRWQAPQPLAAWSGIRQATTAGSPCMQPANDIAGKSVSEDCLKLNVYVPDDLGNEKLPVMVWIHGGGFLTGSGNLYDLSTLARKGRMVVVALQYRLGALGFFRLPESDRDQAGPAPLNFGLMDQQAALRWVQSEIGAFGGDASRVTLMGQSAGGASACMQMVSPGAAGLFQRVIIQSGLCTPVASPSTAEIEAGAAKMAEALGCPAGPGRLDCLRSKPASDIVAQSASSASIFESGLVWSPAPDEVVLPGDPATLVREGRLRRVPVLMGTNHDEGRLYVAMDYHLKTLLPISTKQLTQAYARAAKGDAALEASLAGIYTAKSYGTRDKALGALITDVISSCEAMRMADDLAGHTTVYHYEFNEPNTPGMFDPYMAMGAFHAVELRYLFQVKLAGPTFNLPLSKAQQKLADTMVAYWSRFAAQGRPQAEGAADWPVYTPGARASLAITSQAMSLFDAASFRQDHHCELWDGR